MSWTDERVEELKSLWAEGLSCSQIARRMGDGATRSAVIGKVHRLGLPGRSTPASFARKKAPIVSTGPKLCPRKLPEERTPPRPALTLEDGSHVTLLTLASGMCKYPIGNPQDDDFHFCGHAQRSGAVYCDEHCREAYTPHIRRQSAIDKMKRAEHGSGIRRAMGG